MGLSSVKGRGIGPWPLCELILKEKGADSPLHSVMQKLNKITWIKSLMGKENQKIADRTAVTLNYRFSVIWLPQGQL